MPDETLLAAYDAERADFQRLAGVVRRIQSAGEAELLSLDWLVARIREVGLVPIPGADFAYGGETCVNASEQGLIQLPLEFARWLLLAARYRPASYLEIGTFNGSTATFAAAYLARFNPGFRATTLDVFPRFLFHHEVAALVPLDYEVGVTSIALRGRVFDAVFIDGSHEFTWALADYRNVGRAARLCAFHDVNNAPYRDLPMGGVCAVWELVRREEGGPGIEFHEFFEHPGGDVMGIGVRVKTGAEKGL